MAWDTKTTKQQADTQADALKAQVVHGIGAFSPFWRGRFKSLGTKPSGLSTPAALENLAAVGERDVCPDGSPAGAAALVLQAAESGWVLHADGPLLRKALGRRLLRRKGSYQSIVEADTRPTSFVYAGLGFRWPVASTRSDLDVVARAGARLWQVLGLTGNDVLVSALPLTPTAELQALQLAAVGASSPALFPGDDPDEVAKALQLLPATVLAVPAAAAGRVLDDLDEAGAPIKDLKTLLLVGAPTAEERAQAAEALGRLGSRAAVLAAHVPDGHRLMWGECREGGKGLHTYPDLEVVQLVDPETGEKHQGSGAAEVVLTQLGMRGSALLRWRTGDLAEGITTAPCSACNRTVPRVVGAQRRALVPDVELRNGRRGVDLRAVAAALLGRADVADWRVVLTPSSRRTGSDVLVHVVPKAGADETEVAVAVARDVRAASGLLPTQVVVDEAAQLPAGTALSSRVLTGV